MVSGAHLLLPPLSFLICLSVLLLQIIAVICYWRKYSSTIDTIFVITCVVICFLCNTLQCLIGILLETALPNCSICYWGPLTTQLLYTTTRLFVYLFYLQRSRLAQSFKPSIPNYYFTKIFPAIFFVSYISMMLLFYFKEGNTAQCIDTNKQIPSVISTHWCSIETAFNGHYVMNIGAFMEIIVTIFFGYLFVLPLLRLIISNEKLLKIEKSYQICDGNNRLSIFDSFGKTQSFSPSNTRLFTRRNTSHSSMIGNLNNNNLLYSERTDSNVNINNTHNTRYIQTIELKKALWYNVILSILSLIASVCTMLIWPISPNKYFYIPYCDYITNSITTFIMLGRNRKFIYILCYKICTNCYGSSCVYCCNCVNNYNGGNKNNETLINNGLLNIAGINTLNENSNNIKDDSGMLIDQKYDDSLLSATDTYFQHRKLLNLSHHTNIPNYHATDSYYA